MDNRIKAKEGDMQSQDMQRQIFQDLASEAFWLRVENRALLYRVVRGEVKQSLNRPDELEKFTNRKDPIVKRIVGEELTITPDMPEELVKELVKVAEKLTEDAPMADSKYACPDWFATAGLAENTNIESDIFGKLAEKLSRYRHWRVQTVLIANPNTPTMIREQLKKDNAELLDELGKLSDSGAMEEFFGLMEFLLRH